MLWGLLQAAVKLSARAQVLAEGLPGEGFTFKFMSVVVGRIPFLDDGWAESISSQAVLGQRSPSGLCHTKRSCVVDLSLQPPRSQTDTLWLKASHPHYKSH